MEKIGIKKEIDSLGRILIPKEIRKIYGFENEVEIIPTKDGILIKNSKYDIIFIEKKALDKK
ncbi:MAG: hypothetical protein J6A54_03045 [Clostridia bacterium]|nr:hypothetical protein [Clostridia bacterium]